MKRFNLINDITGWACFLIAALTYLLTVEPTASFWDCPEFILQGAKLEVGHPPGNPIFMLAARFFITLFGGSMSTAALAVNSMSALLSAGTILLLFWSITHLVRRLIVSDNTETISWWKTVVIMAGGVCGALAYTWSDTFWFSAVEGEVYAFSSFCTALVIWLMFKWENRADAPHSDRYLVLIAYVIGVSIAVHLLSLLCIPALGLIFYYRKWRNVSALGSIAALAVSTAIVGAILYGLVPGFVQVAQWFELLFINGFGLSYNLGVLIYAIILTAVFIFAVKALYQHRSATKVRVLFLLAIGLSGMPFIGHSVAVGIILLAALAVYLWRFCKQIPVRIFTLIILSVFVIFIGYSSYALLLIRASANTPMNQNAPDNVFALASYLNREQYGDRPLFLGPVFAETFVEEEYPQGSGNFYIPVDEYGRPKTRIVDGYLRNSEGAAFNNPQKVYTKAVKADPSEPDRYVLEVERPDYTTMPDLNMLFTRIYSNDSEGRHVAGYKAWAGYSTPDIYQIPSNVRAQWAQAGFAPKYEVMQYLPGMSTATSAIYSDGSPAVETPVWKPGFDVNLRYFINYQLNHMYWRYFMWNFAGRQNDIQGNGEPHLGNWISGIPFIDNARLGDQSSLPDEFGKGNKGHNVFYMLPLLLGLLGLLYQSLYRHRVNPDRGIQQFWIVFFLFFTTGIAIVLYLNQTPGQPRERDYAYAGSFYAFAMWIGMGIPAIAVMLRNLFAPKQPDGNGYKQPSKKVDIATAAVACIVAVAVPLQMVSQTWDDHDRSGRYTTRDFGFNYLSSVDPDGIIFTNGDNDTFPLWYAQEVENFRTDVRVVNLSYLTTDWYANQMQHPTSGANAIPMLASPADYAYEGLAYSYILPYDRQPVPALESLAQLYKSDTSQYGVHMMTSPNIVIPFDSSAALNRYSSGNPLTDSIYIAPKLSMPATNLASSAGINQSRVLSLDMIASSAAQGWKRPAYFATTVPSSYYLGLSPYLSATGLAYEVTPFRNSDYNVTADKAYCNIISNYRWGGLDAPDADKLYLDETVRRMVTSLRSGIYTIVENLLLTGNLPASTQAQEAAAQKDMNIPTTRYDMARQLLMLIEDKLPVSTTPYDGMLGLYFARTYIDLYLATGNVDDLDRALSLVDTEADRYAQLVKYASSLDVYNRSQLGRSETYALQYLSEAVALRNYIDILKAKPEIQYAPEYEAAYMLLDSAGLDFDLRIAPLLYIGGYSADELRAQRDNLDAESIELVDKMLGLLELNSQAAIDPTAYSRLLMERHGFTASQWLALID